MLLNKCNAAYTSRSGIMALTSVNAEVSERRKSSWKSRVSEYLIQIQNPEQHSRYYSDSSGGE